MKRAGAIRPFLLRRPEWSEDLLSSSDWNGSSLQFRACYPFASAIHTAPIAIAINTIQVSAVPQ